MPGSNPLDADDPALAAAEAELQALDAADEKETAASSAAPARKAAPRKRTAAVKPPTKPAGDNPSGASPADKPEEAKMDELIQLKEAYSSLAASYDTLLERHNALLSIFNGTLQREVADEVRKQLEPIIVANRGLGTPAVVPFVPTKPELSEAVYTALYRLDRDTFVEPSEAAKDVLERIVTGLKGDYPKASRDEISDEILDKAADLKFTTHAKFARVLDEVTVDVYSGTSGKSGSLLGRFKSDKPAKAPKAPKPASGSGGSRFDR